MGSLVAVESNVDRNSLTTSSARSWACGFSWARRAGRSSWSPRAGCWWSPPPRRS